MKILVAFTANLLWASVDAFHAYPTAWTSVRPTASCNAEACLSRFRAGADHCPVRCLFSAHIDVLLR